MISITNDIINSLDLLQDSTKQTEKKYLESPIISIITPEWYYSTSEEIPNSIEIRWNPFYTYLRDKVDSTLSTINPELYEDQFESTFSCWYQPYHYLPRKSWGIHIRYDSLVRMALKFAKNCQLLNSSINSSITSSFFYFFTHNLYHYLFENAVTLLEIILKKPLLYQKYQYDIYEPSFNSSNCLEEILANRYLLDKCENFLLDKKYIYKLISGTVDGYKDYIKYSKKKFLLENRRLLFKVLYGEENNRTIEPIEQIMHIEDSINLSYHKIPIFINYIPKELQIN